jgi:hypothetical protein
MVRPEDRPTTVEKLNRMIYAELPDKDLNPELYDTVTRHMLHGPCGDANPQCPCMVDGSCKNDFPMDVREETEITHNHYAMLRRRADGRSVHLRGVDMDSRWVVSYNPTLMKMDCHINVECINSIASLKYLFKYLLKGPDRSIIAFQNPDEVNEIEQYVEARYIGPIEACMHLFGVTMYVCQPSITRLPLHLENEQRIAFRDPDQARLIVAQPPPVTELTAWLDYNRGDHLDGGDVITRQTNLDFAHQLRYVDFPRWFSYHKDIKVRVHVSTFLYAMPLTLIARPRRSSYSPSNHRPSIRRRSCVALRNPAARHHRNNDRRTAPSTLNAPP